MLSTRPGKWTNMQTLYQMLRSNHPTFDLKTYRASSVAKLVRACKGLETKKGPNGFIARLPTQNTP